MKGPPNEYSELKTSSTAQYLLYMRLCSTLDRCMLPTFTSGQTHALRMENEATSEYQSDSKPFDP